MVSVVQRLGLPLESNGLLKFKIDMSHKNNSLPGCASYCLSPLLRGNRWNSKNNVPQIPNSLKISKMES